jgi:hypothetical protein
MVMREIKTIPTIHSIFYLIDILKAMGRGECSFEEIQSSVKNSRKKIESSERGGFSLGKRNLSVKEKELSYMWNQSAKNLRELMQLELVKERPLKYSVPSGERDVVETYRRERYELTEEGLRLARVAKSDLDIALDEILGLMYKLHPRFRAFVTAMQKNEVFLFPEITAEMVKRPSIGTKEYVEYVCRTAGELLKNTRSLESSVQEMVSYLEGYVMARLKSSRIGKGKLEDVVIKSMNRGIKNLLFKELRLDIDIPSFEVLTNWCKQFRICNFARGLPDMPGLTLYSTANVETNETIIITRRTKEMVLSSVIEDTPKFFFKFKTRGSPWTSIYPIRAAVCFKNRIDDEVFDDIISDIVNKGVDIDYKLAVDAAIWATPSRSTRPVLVNGRGKVSIISIYEWKGG